MPQLAMAPPHSPVEPVTEVVHGVRVTDSYRWLEDQDSPKTRGWIDKQIRHTRAYMDSLPGREFIARRIREFLAVDTYDSVFNWGERYFFRKRNSDQEQPSIYMREGPAGEDQLLVDPSDHGSSAYVAVRPLRVSSDGRFLLYERKEGGERTGTFAILDIENRTTLPDVLPRGYLRGFSFAPNCEGFYYVHENVAPTRPFYWVAYYHALGTSLGDDAEIFSAGEELNLRLYLIASEEWLGFIVNRFRESMRTDFYVAKVKPAISPKLVLENADYAFDPVLVSGRIVAKTDLNAPNFRIAEFCPRPDRHPGWSDIIPEQPTRINDWRICGEKVIVSYVDGTATRILVFDLSGKRLCEIPIHQDETARLPTQPCHADDLPIETESFVQPIRVSRCSLTTGRRSLWAERKIPDLDATRYSHLRVRYTSRDGTSIPMSLVGTREALSSGRHPTIMTSYGGFGICMTPQFSVFVAFLIERGCLFALPNIRGGSEFGSQWHSAAKRHKRHLAFDDFVSAAEWLIASGRTDPEKLAIFGGSNSGLLVGVAMTQRPQLFCAVVCMVPVLDMLRYHRFDSAHAWKDEFGTADNADDFAVLLAYSPYHNLREGTSYPAVLIVSGDSDQNCNPLHARKMTAALQAANGSQNPILLDYSRYRGHSPVLPLSVRIEALTDRMAFLCDRLQLPV